MKLYLFMRKTYIVLSKLMLIYTLYLQTLHYRIFLHMKCQTELTLMDVPFTCAVKLQAVIFYFLNGRLKILITEKSGHVNYDRFLGKPALKLLSWFLHFDTVHVMLIWNVQLKLTKMKFQQNDLKYYAFIHF